MTNAIPFFVSLEALIKNVDVWWWRHKRRRPYDEAIRRDNVEP